MASLMREGGRHLHSLVHQVSHHQHGQPDEGKGRHLHSLVYQGGGVLNPSRHYQIKYQEAARRQPLLLQWGVARPALVSWLWRRRPRRSFYSARRGHEDDGGEGSEPPRRGSIFSLRRSSHVSFCPKFHFYFCEWQWNLVLHHFVLISMQQHVNRARAPKHVMRVEIYWEKNYRKGLLSIKRSGGKLKNIMIQLFFLRKNAKVIVFAWWKVGLGCWFQDNGLLKL